jgi:hypothetical protein
MSELEITNIMSPIFDHALSGVPNLHMTVSNKFISCAVLCSSETGTKINPSPAIYSK